MKLNTLLSLSMIALATLFSSCEDTATTKSGVVVSYESRGDEALKDSSVLLINMRYITETGADLFNSAERGGPITLPYYAAQWDTSRVFYEVLSTVKVGDSISFQIDATELYLKTFGQPVPDSIGAESNIQFYVGVEDQMTFDEFQEYRVARVEKEQAKMAEEEKSRTEEQGAEIDTFLSENGIEDVVVTESGLRYVITESAEGPKPVAGDVVIVHYNGTLMDSTKFDSSYDRDQPFEFPLGQGRVIPGWDEGIALLNVGSKATLFVPSALAYGSRGAGGIIKPNSILKFEVELIGIK